MNNLKIMIVSESGECLHEESLNDIREAWLTDVAILGSKDKTLTDEEAIEMLKESAVQGIIDAVDWINN